MCTVVLVHIFVQRFGIWVKTMNKTQSVVFFFHKFVSWGRWRGTEAAPESAFLILQLQNCPPSSSSPLFSCSLTFGQMCPHQVDHNLQGFPHKSVKPVYWASLLFRSQRDPFASLGEFSIILISWTIIPVAIHCTLIVFPHNSTCVFLKKKNSHIFYCLTAALVGMNRLNFDLFFPFGLAVRSWSVLGEVGTTSTWLSPLSWVYCCGRTSPTDEDKPWVQSPTRFPFGHHRVTAIEEEKRR